MYEYVCTRSMHVTGRGRYDARSSNFTENLKSTRVRTHAVTHFAYGGHMKRGVRSAAVCGLVVSEC